MISASDLPRLQPAANSNKPPIAKIDNREPCCKCRFIFITPMDCYKNRPSSRVIVPSSRVAQNPRLEVLRAKGLARDKYYSGSNQEGSNPAAAVHIFVQEELRRDGIRQERKGSGSRPDQAHVRP